MKTTITRMEKKRNLSLLICLLLALTVRAEVAEGVIYFKDGHQLEVGGDDRLELPMKDDDVKVFKSYYSRKREEQRYEPSGIDSIVCWHPASKQARFRLCMVQTVGWCWLYIGTPFIHVLVYASKGYALTGMGGISATQVDLYGSMFGRLVHSKCDFYLEAPGKPLRNLGNAYKKADRQFVDSVCDYVKDDPVTVARLRTLIGRNRSHFLMELADYQPL